MIDDISNGQKIVLDDNFANGQIVMRLCLEDGKSNTFKLGYADGIVRIYTDEEYTKVDILLPEVRPMIGDDTTLPEGWKLDNTVQDGWKRGVNDDAAMRGNIEAVTPDDDMTAKPDLVTPGGWKSLMPSLENVVTRKLCLAKLFKIDVVVMNAVLALKIDVHDVTKPSQLMKFEKVVTDGRSRNALTELLTMMISSR